MRLGLIRLAVAMAAAVLWLAPANAQLRTEFAVAEKADLIAVYTAQVERQLVRLRFDRTAGRVTLEPFANVASDIFAVGPKGAFVVVPGTNDEGHTLVLLDGQGRALGAPVPNPLGAITSLIASPKGDLVAAVNDRGWVGVFAVAGTGPARHLEKVAVFGASPRRQLAVVFRPEGGLATLTDDWL
ncbi:MAG: hypothetical protein KIT16_17165, partial [Rhodospirillaceae bacterium]|nr:hypothetical protein [Rhodospirillaceae bacterium]